MHRNLELCFPEMSEQERRKMVVKNFESVGMGLMETGKAWFWPDRRIARWTEVIGMEHIRDVQAQKRGILLVGIHFLTLELGARQFGMQEPGIGVYRPNDNPLIDWLKMVVKNFESVGMGLMETGMAWYWPDRRIARWTEVIGMEHIRDVQAQKRGILLVVIHFLTLELGARQFGMQEPGIGVYRPNDNPLIDWLQTWGRLRSNKSMLGPFALK